MKIKPSIRREILTRDGGCVFCSMGYRAGEYVPLRDRDVYTYKGKSFAMSKYHAQFLAPSNLTYYGSRRREMRKILDCYLADKEDPEVF